MFFTESRTQTFRITQEHSRSPMSTQEHPQALMSSVKYIAKALWVVWVPYYHAHESLSELMSAVCSTVPSSWAFMVAYKCLWELKSGHWPSLVLMSAYEYLWALISNYEQSCAWCHDTNSTHECQKHSWAFHHGGHTTYSAFATYLTVFLSAHECSWALLSAHGHSSAVLSDRECLSSWFSNKQKVLTFEMTSLLYFGNILVKISPNNNKMDT